MVYIRRPSTAVLLGSLYAAAPALAHTWVEQLMVIAPNGTMIGAPGFPRGNVLRTTAGFGDTAMVNLIPPNGGPANKIDANQLMCRPQQTTQTQTDGSPRLKAAPGQSIALRYQENGHVTLPQNQPGKPKGSGANFVYLTSNTKPDDKFLQIHRQWTPDGTGGDARGKLISTQNFDDGQCYQVNGNTISKQRQATFPHQADKVQGQDLWCQQDIQIPADAKPGTTITLYWVWDWPTLPGTAGFPDGKQEIYTTCIDVDIIEPVGNTKAVSSGANQFVKQDFVSAAASAQFADIANPTAVKAQIIPFSSVSAGSASTALGQSTRSIPSGNSVVPTSLSTSSRSSPLALSTSVSSRSPASTTLSTRPLASTISTIVPGQKTVTVEETVTATSFASRSRNVPPVTETKFVTVVVTQTAADKRQASPSPAPIDSSTTKQAYRLRARNPFYILPSQDSAGPSAGAPC